MQIQKNKNISSSYEKTSNYSWIELDKNKFFKNIDLLKQQIKTKIFSLVVKANAYGHGLLPIAKMADENLNIDYLCTFKLSEAIFLRKNRIKKPIFTLGLIDAEIEEAVKRKIELTVYNLEMAQEINSAAEKLNSIANIHIKIDTGLSRLGFLFEDIESIKKIKALSNICIKGIYSHFAEADIEDDSFTRLQIQRFKNLINELKKYGIEIPYKHIENSSAAIRFNDLYDFNFVRIGGAAYGIKKEFINNNFEIDLQPIFEWKSKLMSVKTVPAGSYISYQRTFKAEKDMTLGIIPVGYCDGYDRRFSNNSFVVINNKKAKVLGRVCMNMIILDLTDINASIGTEVLIMGDSPEINSYDLSKKLNTINYELLTRINNAIIRVIKE